MRYFLCVAVVLVLSAFLVGQTSATAAPKEPSAVSPGTVAGRVVRAVDGLPLKSAHVALRAIDSESNASVFAVSSDSDGRFQIKNIPPGRYNFFASHDGFLAQDYQPNGSHGETLVDLKPGLAITDVLFRMRAASVITGRVTNDDGEPMVRIVVSALRKPDEDEFDGSESAAEKDVLRPAASARTDDRGQYRIFGLKSGEYYIEALQSFEPDRNDPTLGGRDFWVDQQLGSEYAPSFYPGVTQTSQAQTVVTKAGSEAQADFIVQRIKTVAISGRVLGNDGPVKSASVNLEPAGETYYGEGTRQTNTDEKGNFRLEGISPGSYFIVVYAPKAGGDSYEEQGRQKIEVGTGNLDSITITVGGGVPIPGHITIVGTPAPEMDRLQVNLSPAEPERWFGAYARVKEDGTFEIPAVRPGGYRVFVWNRGSDWYVKSARSGTNDLLEKGLQVEDSAPEKIEIVLSSATAELGGLVTDGDRPVAGARVVIARDPENHYRQSGWQRTVTDQNGRFSITGIPPGTYRVIARSESGDGDSFKSDPQFVTFSERDHKTIEMKIVQPQTD